MDIERKDIIEIAEGLRLIEEGVEKIQNVMREKKITSLQEVAAGLLPIFKSDDDTIREDVLRHLG